MDQDAILHDTYRDGSDCLGCPMSFEIAEYEREEGMATVRLSYRACSVIESGGDPTDCPAVAERMRTMGAEVRP